MSVNWKPFENGDSLESCFVIPTMHVETRAARSHGRDRGGCREGIFT